MTNENVKPIPDRMQRIIPYLVVEDAAAQIEFCKTVFGADERERITDDNGRVIHAEVWIGDCLVMMGGAREDSPQNTATLYIYMEDTDATYRRALEAGAESLMEPADQFYGDRNAGVRDGQGTTWWIASRVENLSQEEVQRRSAERRQQQ